jgi:hypothetical protein
MIVEIYEKQQKLLPPLLNYMGIWEETRVQKHEHAKVVRHTCIADIVVTTTILLLLLSVWVNYYYYYYLFTFVYFMFTSILMFMEAIIYSIHKFIYF